MGHNAPHIYNELSALLRNGDTGAFKEIYNLYYPRLFSLARRVTGSAEDAEDIIADAFLKLWNQREQQGNLDAIGAFLMLNVKHKCYDLLRHKSVKLDRKNEIIRSMEADFNKDVSVELIRTELVKLIYEAVNNLPEKMRQIFLLSYRDGLQPAEIAKILSLNPQTVKNQKLRAIKLIRDVFGDKALLLPFFIFFSDRWYF